MGRDNWTPERLTPRDVVVDRQIVVAARCSGCLYTVELNVWTVGARLADDPFQIMRFRCRRCGAYATSLEVGRRNNVQGEKLFTILLRPRFWDQGHDENQQAALTRLARR
ncbi:hypothetical protein [Brevundimonas sp. Leaf168]|uniref:hypothetical protein n=1 Tax=Brevundimonas sp. Leaf168 TaxID=1736283 RepID=UPI0006F64345|nr:hypothetical protein [Brevundimonas sp. Leaf168]KQR52973.1 hypothetical protein ASF81_11995 [Brevundimonas sp. Leaf168]